MHADQLINMLRIIKENMKSEAGSAVMAFKSSENTTNVTKHCTVLTLFSLYDIDKLKKKKKLKKLKKINKLTFLSNCVLTLKQTSINYIQKKKKTDQLKMPQITNLENKCTRLLGFLIPDGPDLSHPHQPCVVKHFIIDTWASKTSISSK